MVDSHRVADIDSNLGDCVVCGCDAVSDALYAGHDLASGRLAYGAKRSFDDRDFGDHIGRGAGRDLGHGKDRWIEGVDRPGDHRLERSDHLGRNRNRVERQVWHRRVATPAAYNDLERVGRCHEGSAPCRYPTSGCVWCDVESEGCVDAFEYALVDHERGPGKSLFARLKHEPDRAAELIASCCQVVCGANEHRRVGIVATRVHGALNFRGEVQASVFRHRQRIHVAAKQDRGAGTIAKVGCDGCGRRTCGDVEAESRKPVENGRLSFGEIEPEFGVTMKLTSKVNEQWCEIVVHESER